MSTTKATDSMIVGLKSSKLTGNLPALKKIVRPDGLTIKTEIESFANGVGTIGAARIEVGKFIITDIFYLPYFNCYSFGNGVESNRVRDGFNLPLIDSSISTGGS